MMASQDEPLTPRVQFFLRPELNTHTFSALFLESPIDVDELKSAIKASPIPQAPRFCSVVVLDEKTQNVKGWRRLSHIDLDRHFVVVAETLSGSCDTDPVNQYIADLVMNKTLDTKKPLWEIHILLAHQCIVLWAHHVVGDGASFMSLLQASFCKTYSEKSVKLIQKESSNDDRKSMSLPKNRDERRWRSFEFWWFSAKFIIEFAWKSLVFGDRKTGIYGGAGAELLPRKLSTATFSIDDMKLIKLSVPDSTINDVFFTIISAGIGRYFELRSGSTKEHRITCVCLANLRKRPGLWDISDMNNEWGNKFGVILLPIHCHEATTNPLEYLKSVRVTLRRKKLSFEADFSYKIVNLANLLFGVKIATKLAYNMLSNTTLMISNMVGPKEEMEIGGNRVMDLRANISSLPQSLGMHMVSYKGKANLQILVAEDIIPDPEFLANCFENALLELKRLALASTDSTK